MNRLRAKSTSEMYYSSPSRGAEKKISLNTALIGAFVCVAIGIVAGFSLDHVQGKLLNNSSDLAFDSALNEVYHALDNSYYGDIDRSKVIEEAKRGLVNAVNDPYSYYMTSDEYREFDDDLNGKVGAGIGVEVSMRDGYVKVMRTTPDNPAREAGILAGDIISKVDDRDVLGLDVEEVVKYMRGEEGTKVKITVLRDGKEHSFDITRETINDKSVYVDYRDNDTAILTIKRFDNETGMLAEGFAKEFKDKGIKKLILDLRGNGGGYVNAAVDVASLWVDGQLITSAVSEQHPENNQEYYAKTGKAILKDMHTIILTNGMTASASEILTGALKEYGKATVLGERSFGKGCMQALLNLSDGGVLRVTIANWFTPNGKNISDGGIEPDKEIERTYEQINKEIDPQLDAALKM